MDRAGGKQYEFGAFLLDPAEHLLMREGQPVTVTPKAFDLLAALVENRGRLMSKEALLEQVWPDSFVEEANLSVKMSELRRALGETPNANQYIETVPRKGYRFVAEVAERPSGIATRSVSAVFDNSVPKSGETSRDLNRKAQRRMN